MKTIRIKSKPYCNIIYSVYSQKEIKEIWSKSKALNKNFPLEPEYSVIISCTDEMKALELHALFVRDVFADLDCVYYDSNKIYFYCGDSGDHEEIIKTTKLMILKYELFGLNEHEILFEEDISNFNITNIKELKL